MHAMLKDERETIDINQASGDSHVEHTEPV